MERGRRRFRGGAAAVVGLLLGVLTACSAPAVPGAPTPAPYDGPLWVAPDPALDLWHDPGAAGRVVTCDQPVLGESNTEPFEGGGEVGETARAGLDEGRDDGLWSGLDDDGMREVRTEPDRVLYTYEAGGRVLQAVVMRHGRVAPGRGAGADGIAWFVESSARCDVVEYPDGLAESRGSEVWTDVAGRRISSQVISSSTSDGDCLTAGTRILQLQQGDDDVRRYLAHGEAYPDVVDEPYREGVPLPTDAVDSGYRHGDERLWFSDDSRRAYVGNGDRVDVWPRLTDGFGCG